ncbi:hypothetical protein D3C79_616890 [compost metagenome]
MHQRGTDRFGRLGQVDGIDLGPYCHQCLDRPLGKVQHTADHHPFATVEQHMLFTAFNQVGNFFTDFISLDAPPTQQAQYRMGSAFTQWPVLLQAAFAPGASDLVEHFDQDREADCRIQIALGNVETQAFGSQAETNHHQEAQTQHDHRWMAVDEACQWLAGNDHDANGEDHRDHHHRQVFHHTDSRDHRIEREHRIEHHDLRHDRPERGMTGIAVGLGDMAFKALVQLHGGLEQQEPTTKQHDQVTTGEALAKHLDQRRGQGHHPGNTGQQAQAHDQRQGQTDHPRTVALMRR